MNMRVERKKYLDHKIDISCIILSNLNDLFVKKRTIPSIRNNSKLYNIEIIVVDNSPSQDFEYEGVKVIHTEPYHIPIGYNTGVSKAKGKYIALFHDDVEILDDKWIEKLTNELDNNIWAVGPDQKLYTRPDLSNIKSTSDYDLENYLKEAPLVMERKNFLDIGGYDETYYFGYENKVFCKEIKNNGKKIKKVDIGYVHFGAMSTILLCTYGKSRDILKYNFMKTTDKNKYIKKYQTIRKKFTLKMKLYLIPKEELHMVMHYHNDARKYMPKTKKQIPMTSH